MIELLYNVVAAALVVVVVLWLSIASGVGLWLRGVGV